MNLGLGMAKPGESDLGLAMRLWYANRAVWNKSSQSWDTRVRHATQSIGNRDGHSSEGASGLQLAVNLHAKAANVLPFLEPASLGTQWPRSKCRRQCLACAEHGFHTFLFDYPWMSRCPVHDIDLTDRCPTCHDLWPTAAGVASRKCKVCGTHRELDDLISDGAFDTAPYIEKLEPYLTFFEAKISFFVERRSYPFDCRRPRESQVAQRHLLPSIIRSQQSVKIMNDKCMSEMGINLLACQHHAVTLSSEDNPPARSGGKIDISAMASSRRRVYNRANKALKQCANHKIGSCKTDERLGHFLCVHCESWRQLNLGFRPALSNRGDVDVMQYSPPFTHKISVIDPGLITSIYDPKTHLTHSIDGKTSTLIYETELWLSIHKMVAQVDFYLKSSATADQHFQNHSSPFTLFLSHAYHHFGHFFFVKNASGCELVFPKAYLSNDFNDQAQLLSILKDEKG